MSILPANLFCRVGVALDRQGVGLAVRRRRGRSFAYRALADGENRAKALSVLVMQEGVAGARCVVSLPVGRCRVQWVALASLCAAGVIDKAQMDAELAGVGNGAPT